MSKSMKQLPNRKGFRNKSELERIGEIVASVAGFGNSDIVAMYEQHEDTRMKRVGKDTDPVRRETLNKNASGSWKNWMKAGGMDPSDPSVQDFCKKVMMACDKPHRAFDRGR
tara:strand:+ start:170 stop:505 length:336 start_codon:yes stop_codon:yes gene_type:complete